MQTQPQYSLIRRVLFPYSGREQLSLRQSLRLVIIWALLFTSPMVLCTLGTVLLAHTPTAKSITILLSVLLGGLIIFGLTAWVVVRVTNRTAQISLKSERERAEIYKDQ
jgi:hypothetical protein